MPAPTVTSFAPSTAGYGSFVVLTGTSLTGATSVTFNGAPSSFVVDSATQITATVPSGATTGAITVTTAGGSGASSSFTLKTAASIFEACTDYLEAQVVSVVNTDFGSTLLVAGSVASTREPRGPSRVQSPFPVSVEIVPVGPWASRAIGIGIEELDLVFDLKIEVRKKAVSSGRSQLDVLDDVARALVRAWRNVSTLSIAPASATFRRSNASLVTLDETPDTIETARAVVRVTLTFTEAQA